MGLRWQRRILVEEVGPVEIFTLRLAIGLPFLGVGPLANARGSAGRVAARARGALLRLLRRTNWLARCGRYCRGDRRHRAAGVARPRDRFQWMRSTGDWWCWRRPIRGPPTRWRPAISVRRRPPLAATFAMLSVAAVFTAILFAITGDPADIRGLSTRGMLALLYLATPGLALGQWFWQEGVAKLGASRGSVSLSRALAAVALAVAAAGRAVRTCHRDRRRARTGWCVRGTARATVTLLHRYAASRRIGATNGVVRGRCRPACLTGSRLCNAAPPGRFTIPAAAPPSGRRSRRGAPGDMRRQPRRRAS